MRESTSDAALGREIERTLPQRRLLLSASVLQAIRLSMQSVVSRSLKAIFLPLHKRRHRNLRLRKYHGVRGNWSGAGSRRNLNPRESALSRSQRICPATLLRDRWRHQVPAALRSSQAGVKKNPTIPQARQNKKAPINLSSRTNKFGEPRMVPQRKAVFSVRSAQLKPTEGSFGTEERKSELQETLYSNRVSSRGHDT